LLDSAGRILVRAPIRRPALVTGTVHLLTGRTLYTRFGDWFVVLCAGFVVLAVWCCRPRLGGARTDRPAPTGGETQG
jgi:apolipoprotein N-acyltransferase